jgi:hypothetical protein
MSPCSGLFSYSKVAENVLSHSHSHPLGKLRILINILGEINLASDEFVDD